MMFSHVPFGASAKILALGFGAAAWFIPVTLFPSPVTAVPNNRPNIVLILADDLGFADLGCYGSEIETPPSRCAGR